MQLLWSTQARNKNPILHRFLFLILSLYLINHVHLFFQVLVFYLITLVYVWIRNKRSGLNEFYLHLDTMFLIYGIVYHVLFVKHDGDYIYQWGHAAFIEPGIKLSALKTAALGAMIISVKIRLIKMFFDETSFKHMLSIMPHRYAKHLWMFVAPFWIVQNAINHLPNIDQQINMRFTNISKMKKMKLRLQVLANKTFEQSLKVFESLEVFDVFSPPFVKHPFDHKMLVLFILLFSFVYALSFNPVLMFLLLLLLHWIDHEKSLS